MAAQFGGTICRTEKTNKINAMRCNFQQDVFRGAFFMPFYWCDQTKTARVDIKMRLPDRRFPYLPVKKSFRAHNPDNSVYILSIHIKINKDRNKLKLSKHK